MAGNTIKVTLIGDWKDLKKTFNESQTGAEKWAGKMSRAGTAMTVGVTGPIVAGAALAVNAAIEEEQQMEKLADTIEKRIPGATDEMIRSNESWVTGLQNNIAVADSEIRDMQQSFIAAGASVEESQRLTELAYDTAAQTGKDATTVGNAFVKGINGQVGALGKLGVETKNAAGETMTFDQITGDLADKMGGSAAAAADTTAGRMEKMKLGFADVTESIGTLLIPIVEKLVGWLQKIVEWFQNLDPTAQKVVLAIAGIAAAIGPLLIVGAQLVKGFGAIKKAFDIVKLAMASNPWTLLIIATIALVTLIIANWDKIKKFLLDVWDKIKKGATAVKDWVVNTWNSILDFFRGLPSKIGNAVSGMWDGIKNAFKAAINWIIDKWNDFKIVLGGQRVNLPFGMGFSIPKITLNTPNIPRLHQGGVYQAPHGRREGLALLRSGERVSVPGASQTPLVVNLTVNAGMGADPNAISRAVVEALQRYSRNNGAIPGVKVA